MHSLSGNCSYFYYIIRKLQRLLPPQMTTCFHLLHLFRPEHNTQHFLSPHTASHPAPKENNLCHFLWPPQPSLLLISLRPVIILLDQSCHPLFIHHPLLFISLICSNLPQSRQAAYPSALPLSTVVSHGQEGKQNEESSRAKIKDARWLPKAPWLLTAIYLQLSKRPVSGEE